MQKFKFFVLRGKFSRIAQIFMQFASGEHYRKIQKLKNSFEKQLKNRYAFWQTKLKDWDIFGRLVHQFQ